MNRVKINVFGIENITDAIEAINESINIAVNELQTLEYKRIDFEAAINQPEIDQNVDTKQDNQKRKIAVNIVGADDFIQSVDRINNMIYEISRKAAILRRAYASMNMSLNASNTTPN